MEQVLLQTEWGWQIALYLFFGGLAGGTLAILSVLNAKKDPSFNKTVCIGAWIAAALLIVGVILLATETLMPLRAILLWQSFSHLSSWMSIGAWLLVGAIGVSLLFALAKTLATFRGEKTGRSRLTHILGPIAGLLGVCVAVYTGILLSVLVAHPLWNTWLIPALFTVSALDTGIALVLIVQTATKAHSEAAEKAGDTLERVAIVLIVGEVIILAALFACISGASTVGAKSVALLVSGTLAVPFWVLVVLCGLVCPLLINTFAVGKVFRSAGARSNIALAGAVLCLIGGCALRFVILMAGLPIYA